MAGRAGKGVTRLAVQFDSLQRLGSDHSEASAHSGPLCFVLRLFAEATAYIVEADQVDVLAVAVLSDFEEIKNTEETRFAGEFRRDIWETDGFDRINFNGAFSHSVACTHSDMQTCPKANRAGDFSATHTFPKTFCENHHFPAADRRTMYSAMRRLGTQQSQDTAI